MNTTSKLIVFSCGGKGGVGKTTVATSVADYYATRGIAATLFDCDTENKQRGSLSHFFPNAEKLDIRAERGTSIALVHRSGKLLARYPESKYAEDSRLRLRYLVYALARYEVHVARYYVRRGALLAAANRAQYAISTYPDTPAQEEALFIMFRAYDLMGMSDLRDDAKRVLDRNFPNSLIVKNNGPEIFDPWWKMW